ncbi:MAG: cyclic nucleotide-binding domain-containing protein, partial [Melioribacteraceae bacterium]|nr:cyclic nucleotide-binding domain-containing protein [Melioribacteraceae bacterium]
MQNQENLALKSNSLFKNTNISNITLSDLNLDIKTLEEGGVLFKAGDVASSIYLVIDGEINLLRRRSFSRTTTKIISPNEFFGQEEFFDNTARKSTALAIRDTKIAILNKDDLDSLLNEYNGIFDNIKNSLDEVDQQIVENLEKLLYEKQKNGNKKVSIFDLTRNHEEELRQLNEVKKNEKTINELNDKILRYNELIKQKEEKITSLYDRLDEYQNTHKQLTHMMDNQNEQLARLLDAESNFKSDLKSYTERISELEEKLKESGQNVNNTDFEEMIAVKDAELNNLRQEIQEQRNANFAKEDLQKEYDASLSKLKSEIEHLNQIINSRSEEDNSNKEKFSLEIEALKEKEKQLELLKANNEKAEKEIVALKAEIAELKLSSNHFQKIIDESNKKNDELNKKLLEYDDSLRSLRNDNQLTTNELEKLQYVKESYSKLETEKNKIISNLNQKINNLEKSYQNFDEEKLLSENKIAHQTKEIQNLKELNDKLAKADKYKSEIIGDQSYRISQLEEIESNFNTVETNYRDMESSFKKELHEISEKLDSATKNAKILESLNYETRAQLELEKEKSDKLLENEAELLKAQEHKNEIISKQKDHIE